MIEVNDEPLFSVIVPVFNKEKHVKRAISSVLRQKSSSLEVVVVCDPSSDRSHDIVESIKDSRIRIFYRSEPGPGGYAARNLGIAMARGEWIAFLDADDEWFEDNLKNFLCLIKKAPDCNIFSSARMMCHGLLRKLDSFAEEKKTLLDKCDFIHLSFYEYLRSCVAEKRPVSTNSLVIRKKAIGKRSLFPEGRTSRSGDLYAWVGLISRNGGLIWSPHVSSNSYRDADNMVSKNSLPSLKIFQEMVCELSSTASGHEIIMLKKYANRLIRKGWFENRLAGSEQISLLKYLYFREDVIFCLKWFIVSKMPLESLRAAIEFKRKFKL